MRRAFLILPLAALATPALAQVAPPAPMPPQAVPPQAMPLPRAMTDPRLADRITDAMSAMSKAFLNLPVGEIEAAMEGRQPNYADRRRTVRSETGVNERELERKIDEARPMIEGSQRAMATALPAIMKGLTDAQRELERAMANVPRPDYPRR
jgi:hypothetical protein